MMDEKFYSILKNFFREKKITQQNVADTLHSSNSYVNQLLNGKCSLGRSAAQKLSDAYGLSVAWLLTGEGEMLSSGAAGTVNNISIDASNNVKAGGGVSGSVAVGGSSGNESDSGVCGRLIEQNQQLMDIVSDQQKQINQLLNILSTKL